MRPSSHLLVPTLIVFSWSVSTAYASVNPFTPNAKGVSDPSSLTHVQDLHHDSQKRQFRTADYHSSNDSPLRHDYEESTSTSTDSASDSKSRSSAEKRRRNLSGLGDIIPRESHDKKFLQLPALFGKKRGIWTRGIGDSKRMTTIRAARAAISESPMSPVNAAEGHVAEARPKMNGRELKKKQDDKNFWRDAPVQLHRQQEKTKRKDATESMPGPAKPNTNKLLTSDRQFAGGVMKRASLAAVPTITTSDPPSSDISLPGKQLPAAASDSSQVGQPALGGMQIMRRCMGLVRLVRAKFASRPSSRR
ncbi:hypothetical protein FPV67DRAFT_1002637 [Lyophyllum atratum]|nr:hypothetical protein FPV67DRAFT_1002637 [Lyophyllum atratum]